jgi:hypothetical protein
MPRLKHQQIHATKASLSTQHAWNATLLGQFVTKRGIGLGQVVIESEGPLSIRNPVTEWRENAAEVPSV